MKSNLDFNCHVFKMAADRVGFFAESLNLNEQLIIFKVDMKYETIFVWNWYIIKLKELKGSLMQKLLINLTNRRVVIITDRFCEQSCEIRCI